MRRILVLLLFLVVLLSACQTSQTVLPPAQSFSDYKQIPGVTEEEIEAIESVKSVRNSLEFGAQYSTGAFQAFDGNIGGFYPLMCERLSSLFDIPFETSIYDGNAFYSRISIGEIDFTCEITFDQESEDFFMVDTGIKRSVLAYRIRSAESSQVGGAKDRMAKPAVIINSPVYYDILHQNPDFNPIFVSDYAEAIKMLESGEIDALCDYNTARVMFDAHPDIISNELMPLCFSRGLISTANPELEAFISVIQKYLDYNGREELLALYDRGEDDYNRNKLFVSFSEEEMRYIEDHKEEPIPFAASYDNYPICFYDETKQIYQGISIEVLGEISELTGLTFVPSNEIGTPWAELLDDLENGRTAFVSELIYTKARSEKFIWTDSPYSVDNYALISNVARDGISIEQIPNYSVGVIRGTGYTNDFDAWFPKHDKRAEFSTYAEAFDALANNEIDFVMGTNYLLLNNSNYLERTGFRANLVFDYEYESAFGFHQSQQILCDIFSKAQNKINVEDISQMWTLRVYDYQGKIAEEQSKNNIRTAVILIVLFVIIVSLIMALFARRKQMVDSLNKKLEETVRVRTEELEKQTIAANAASLAKSDFLARMSHEIRTPLNAIIGLARITRQASEPGTKVYNAMNDSIAASLHLLGILNDILDMTKMEAGKVELVIEPFSLKEAMRDVSRIIRESCVEKAIVFESNIEELPPIVVDSDKIRLNQVLINLLGNAIKFSYENSTIRLWVGCELQPDANVAQVLFAVTDDGIGIPEDQLEKIYFAFEQANTTIAENFGGAGLGLSLSQKIVSLMGGSIVVDSKVGEGSTFAFSLTFPVVQYTPLNENEIEVEAVDLSGKRVLIAEDVEINRVILTECLSDTNALIEEARDGNMAYCMFNESPQGYYDIILMDIKMPKMNGYQATESIRALDRQDAKTVPIIAITANAFQDDIDRALKAGMTRHLPKPVDFVNLMRTLRELFP